jgi:DNA repair ATPase RecN
MLPVIIGVGVGIALLEMFNSAEEEAKKSKRKYKDTYNYYNNEINKSRKNMQRKAKLHALKKARRLSIEQANIIYEQLQKERERYNNINNLLKKSKISLNELFQNKRETNDYSKKTAIQENINMVIDVRKKLFAKRDEQKDYLNQIQEQLKMANAKTSKLKNQIEEYY